MRLRPGIRTAGRAGIVLATLATIVLEPVPPAQAGGATLDIEPLIAFLVRSTTEDDVVELPAPGEVVFLSATYQLHGTESSVVADAQALIDGTPVCSGEVELEAGDVFQLLCPTAWKATAGMHNLRWILDGPGKVREADETNNIVDFNFIVDEVDLAAERAYLTTDAGEDVDEAVAGQEVFFNVDYQLNLVDFPVNTGIQGLIDGELGCEAFIDFEPGGEHTLSCQMGWIATPGMHTLTWKVDDTDFVTETDEGNNLAELTFTVNEADLHAVAAFLRADSASGPEIATPEPGRPVFLFLEYESTANLTVDVSAMLDGEPQCDGTINVEAGSGTIFCPEAWIAVEGPHTLQWIIDPDSVVPESNETNNAATLHFGVGTPVMCPGDCDDNGTVATDELLRGIMVMLGLYDLDVCTAFDADLNGVVTIDEAVRAIELASLGC